MPACTLLRAHSSRRTSSDPRPSHVLCGLMKAASHGAVHDAGQPHVDRTGCHARRPLGGITGAGRCGGSSAAGFRWPSLAFRSQIYYFRSSRESEARTCTGSNYRQCTYFVCCILPCFAQLSSPPAAPLSHFSRTSLARLSHGCRHTMGSASRLYDDARKQSGNGFDDERTHSSGSSAPGSTRTG